MGKAQGRSLVRVEGSVEPALGSHDDPLGHVPEHRIARSLVGAPGTGSAGGLALLPDDLAPQQVAESFEEVDHVPGQRPVGLPAQVGHVHGDATTWLQLVEALGEDVVEHPQVGVVVGRDCPDAEDGLVLLAGEVRRRGHHQGHRIVGHLAPPVHLPGVTHPDLVLGLPVRHGAVIGDPGRGEAGIERGRVVGLPAPDPEGGGGRRPATGSPTAVARRSSRRATRRGRSGRELGPSSRRARK